MGASEPDTCDTIIYNFARDPLDHTWLIREQAGMIAELALKIVEGMDVSISLARVRPRE